MSGRFIVVARTDPGRRRQENQDAVLVEIVPVGAPEGESYLVAVADGVGGGPGGKTASTQALRSLSECLSTETLDSPSEALRDGFYAANGDVWRIAQERPELTGMASTLTAAFLRDGQAWLANAGDSRAYIVRSGQAWPVTYDHSWVAEQVAQDKMTQEQADAHPQRNIITRAVGGEESLEPDVYQPLVMEHGDVLLLCSDGLHGVVHDEDIASLCSANPPEQALTQLIALANERGGPDNISVVIAAWDGQSA